MAFVHFVLLQNNLLLLQIVLRCRCSLEDSAMAL